MINYKYQINNEFFQDLENWTEKQAYVLGWILSDGHINKKTNCVSIKLQLSDRQILETIKSIIQYTGPIGVEKRKSCNFINSNFQDRACLTIYSEHLKKSLNELGFDNRKSENMLFPTFLREDLIHHFIRGYFDGDGCISYTYHKGVLMAEMNLIGTKAFCDSLVKILNKQTGCQYRFGTRVYNNGNVRVRLAGNLSMVKLFNFLYADATILFERKFKKFIKIINFTKKQKRILRKDHEKSIQTSIKIAVKNFKCGILS